MKEFLKKVEEKLHIERENREEIQNKVKLIEKD